MGDGWLWVTAHRTGEQGMIFRELVQDLDENIDPNTVFNWFHPNLTKSEAVDLLVKGKKLYTESVPRNHYLISVLFSQRDPEVFLYDPVITLREIIRYFST